MEHVVVAETDDTVAALLQPARALDVVDHLPIMDCSVQLDHQLALGAGEINDEASDRVLPPKLQPGQLPRPQLLPQ